MGKQYRTINSLRSAISITHEEVDGARIGQHPLISRFLKGIYNSRPPAPRYSATWDVDVILTYLSNLPGNEDLSFQLLINEVAMLMALSNADRCSDLAALDLNFRSFLPDGVQFIIPGLTKSRRGGPPIKAFFTQRSLKIPSYAQSRHLGVRRKDHLSLEYVPQHVTLSSFQ